MVTKKQTNAKPAPVAEPAPAPAPAPQQVVYQYAPAPQDPNRGKAKWLSFEYVMAMGSLVTSVLLTTSVLVALFGGWAGQGTMLTTYVGGWAANLLSLSMITNATGVIVAAIMAIIFAVISLVCFGRVSKALPDRAGYTKRTVYKVVTYGAFAAVLLPAIVLAAKLIGILLSSLLFIGVTGAGAVYKSLYIAEFLPYLLNLGLLAGIAVCIAKIIQGRNVSKVAAAIALSVAIVALIASAITVGVQVHKPSKSLKDTYGSSLWRELGY